MKSIDKRLSDNIERCSEASTKPKPDDLCRGPQAQRAVYQYFSFIIK